MSIPEITTNAYVFGGIVFASILVGFLLRTNQIVKSRSRILFLEQEIRNNHEEMLNMQQDFIALELKANIVKGPVIKMRNVIKDERNEKLPDISLRKKLFIKENPQQKSATLSLAYKNLFEKEA